MLNTEEFFNTTGFSKKQWLKAETTSVKLGIIFNTEETNYSGASDNSPLFGVLNQD